MEEISCGRRVLAFVGSDLQSEFLRFGEFLYDTEYILRLEPRSFNNFDDIGV